jgi:hypothetical protein
MMGWSKVGLVRIGSAVERLNHLNHMRAELEGPSQRTEDREANHGHRDCSQVERVDHNDENICCFAGEVERLI